MFFAVITLFPEMFEAITAHGISGRAVKRDIVQVTCTMSRFAARPLIPYAVIASNISGNNVMTAKNTADSSIFLLCES